MTLLDFLRENVRVGERMTVVDDNCGEISLGFRRPPSAMADRATVTSAERTKDGWRIRVDLTERGYPFTRDRLKRAFAECKREAGLDFARTSVASLGDCASCVWYTLCEKHGDDCKGIFLKHWSRGMNGAGDLEEQDRLCIAHDLTEEQAAKVLAVLSRHFVMESATYDRDKCFVLLGQKAGV